ncbi:MAG: ABC transporter ATP-binding protein [Nitrospirae bacterium]|nr:ABC transporter ATP-binding protein [Nitrospirota bacterium]
MSSPSGAPAFSAGRISKGYKSREGVGVQALERVSFEADEGKITCIVGPTGSGKSTILRIMSGLEAPDEGSVRVAGVQPSDMTGRIGYLTQRHTLLPWMKTGDNIGLPLKVRGLAREMIKNRVREIAESLALNGLLDLYPYELSGGAMQRAAIGRLLASDAGYCLLDEPFSALDEKTLHALQRLFLDIAGRSRLSVLFVTHSIDEAVFLADRIIVLSAGPGRVVETFEVDMPHPRDRISPLFGALIERVRQKIESVLRDDAAVCGADSATGGH